MNIQGSFPLGLTGWSPCSPRESQESSPTPHFKSINSLVLNFLYGPTLIFIHDYWKNHSMTRRTFVGNIMSLLFNMLSRLVIYFLPRSKCLLDFMAEVTICSDLGAQKNKVCYYFHCFPIYFPWSDGMILVFWMLSFKPTLSLSSFTFPQETL